MSHSMPGSPIDLTATRRAFALDSRTVWVEQQIVMNGIVSKDNLFVGPMDYDPHIPERHVPVTTIARPKTVDTFHPYRGNTGGSAGLSKRGSGKLKTKKKKKSDYQEPLGDIRGTLGANSRSEYVTPFSDHDKRMPIDPSRRYYITDKPALPVDPFLHSRFHCDGARGPVQSGSVIGKDNTERLRVKPAMPQSDSVYHTDTPLVNKRPIHGKIYPEAVTKNPPQKYDKASQEARAEKKAEEEAKGVVAGHKTVERPPMRLRKQPVLEFDASCYQLNKKEGGVNMTPQLSKNKAKVNVFQGMITTKLGYKSKKIESPLAERVRRNYM